MIDDTKAKKKLRLIEMIDKNFKRQIRSTDVRKQLTPGMFGVDRSFVLRMYFKNKTIFRYA